MELASLNEQARYGNGETGDDCMRRRSTKIGSVESAMARLCEGGDAHCAVACVEFGTICGVDQ